MSLNFIISTNKYNFLVHLKYLLVFYFFLSVLGIEPRPLHMVAQS